MHRVVGKYNAHQHARPENLAPVQTRPNPFNGSTTIRFALNENGDINLAIFDLLGRKVKQLQSGILPAGEHSFTWNGTDDGGANVTSGIYFYRLQSNQGTLTRRMVMLK